MPEMDKLKLVLLALLAPIAADGLDAMVVGGTAP
jgi:hypothetical protein